METVTPETDPDAPLPWLGDAANVSEAQTWSSPPSVLTVRYPFDTGTYFRMMGFYTLRLWKFYVAALLFVAVLPATLFGLLIPNAPVPPIFVVTLTVGTVIGYLLLVGGSTLLGYGLSALWMRGRRFRVKVSAAGVEHRLEPPRPFDVVTRTGWRDVVAATDWEGGFLLEKTWGRVPVLIPAESFADADAANRLHQAVAALWHSRGDFSTVPDDVRREFGANE